MIEFEKRGIPTVSYTASTFVDDAHRSAKVFGLPELPIAEVPRPFTSESPERIRDMVEHAMPQVVAALTVPPPRGRSRASELVTFIDDDWLTYEGTDLLDAVERMNREFIGYGWGDGFPLRPVTRSALEEMLQGTSRPRDEVVAVMEPGNGVATVEKIAANAYMAGCRPDHLPVVITAIECLTDPRMDLRTKAMSTGPAAPLVLVNGPIVDRIGLNYGICTLGPGGPSHVNTVIGRAVRLCMMNVGHTYPGLSDMDTVGSPAKYSFCMAENERRNPWQPYHVEHGHEPAASTVTVMFMYGMSDVQDLTNYEAEALLRSFANPALNTGPASTGFWLIGKRVDARKGRSTEEDEHDMLVIAPEHAEIFRREGWTKADIRRRLHERARLPFSVLMNNKEASALAAAHPELEHLWDAPDTLLPVLEKEECYDIVVVGGTAGRSTYIWGSGGPVTREIRS